MEGRFPSIRDVHTFVLVAQTGSLGVAAQRLNVTISAVSHRIRALEEEVGVALFKRVGRGIGLTAAGVVYKNAVLPLLHNLAMATASAQREADDNLIRIAAFQTFHAYWLAQRVGEFQEMFPAAKLELLSLRSDQSRPDLRIQISRPGEVGSHEDHLAAFEIGPVCHPSLLRESALYDPVEILSLPLIVVDVSGELWPAWAAKAGFVWQEPEKTIFVDNMQLSIELAAAGRGAALAATVFDARLNSMGLFRPFPSFNARLAGIHVNRAEARERPLVGAFRTWLTNAFARASNLENRN